MAGPTTARTGSARRAVFLDRDGTLNVERHFVRAVEQIQLLPGVRRALTRLRDADFTLVVITNQSGVARGYLDERTLARIHERLHSLLNAAPIGYLHCPHHPEQSGPYGRVCRCRKPEVGLIERAVDLFDLSLEDSFVIGDSARDLVATRTLPTLAGGILVRTGKPWREQLERLQADGIAPDYVAADLSDAVDWILDEQRLGSLGSS